jgi:transcriptional regulator with XRE-family HTH domain
MALPPKGTAQRLKTLRQEQARVGEEGENECRLSRHLETGKKQNPSLVVLERLAKALGVPMTELLG